MLPFFERITNLCDGRELLRSRRYGVIEFRNDTFVAVHLKPWPTLPSLLAAWIDQKSFHRRAANVAYLYYNEPLSCPGFLTLAYMRTGGGTTLRTFRSALLFLDFLAELKSTQAMVCQATNPGLSDRFMKRFGWVSHLPKDKGRHYIRRFYDAYPNHDELRHILGQPLPRMPGQLPPGFEMRRALS